MSTETDKVATWEERRKEIKGWMTARRADLKLILELVGDYSAELVASRLLVTGAVGDVTIGAWAPGAGSWA
eukprot:gene6120-7343_t